MFRITKHKTGPKFYILEHRIHHGLSGLVLTVICLSIRRIRVGAIIGVGVMLHDRKDLRSTYWLKDN